MFDKQEHPTSVLNDSVCYHGMFLTNAATRVGTYNPQSGMK